MSFGFFSSSGSPGPPPVVWPPPPRLPMPPLPAGQYDHVLPFTPPPPDLLFYRGNFCGIRVPGIPLLDGMAGFTVPPWNQNQQPFCPPFMAQDIPRYWKRGMVDAVDEILRVYVQQDGYTHLQVSPCHAVEAGLSIDEYLAFCAHARGAGVRFLDHWFLGGVWGERDADVNYWKPICEPWMLALQAAGMIDCCCVGWQLDHFNTGTERMINGRMQSPIQTIIDMFADWCAPKGIPLGTHWVNEAGAWNDPFDRFRWWKDQKGKLSWFHHQGDVTMDIPQYQAKLVDTLQPFGDGRMGTSGLFGDRPYSLIVYECSAQAQFNLNMDEATGDQRGALLCCTKAASFVGGYGNGARQQNGLVL